MGDELKERYRLHEAAEISARGDKAGASQILRKLEQSVRDGSLAAYRSGSNIRHEFNDETLAANEAAVLRTDDLNQPPGGFTWVDKQYDERLREVLHQVPDDLEAYWNDLNDWLAKNESRLNYKFPDPGIPLPEKESAPAPKPPLISVHKLRRNILDPAIDKAVKKVESNNLAEVYLALKELALAGEPPFTGEINGNNLLYTNSNNKVDRLSSEALRQRLKRR